MRRSYSLCLIALVALLAVGAGGKAAAAEKGGVVELTPAEQAWLVKHPSIKLGFNPDMQPLLIQEADGNNKGILPDIYAELEALTGLKISIEIKSWHETIKLAKLGEIDGLLNCVPALAESIGLLPTREFVATIPVVFGKRNAAFRVNSLDDLKGKRVAYLRAVKFIENILAPMVSETTPLAADSFIAALTMVLEGRADVALGMNFDTYILQKSVLTGIEPVFIDTSHVISAVAAVRSDWPELVSILNKGLDALGEAQINKIISTWTQLGTSVEKVSLTEAEKAWLDTRPTIKVRMSNLPPFILMDQGKPAGFSVELLERIADLIGLDLQYIFGVSWPEGLEHIKRQDGKVDLILAAKSTPERRKFMLFSENYVEQPYMIYTRQDNNTIHNIDDLIGKTVAIEEKQALEEVIRNSYPGIRLMKVKGYASKALRAVASGDADAYIGIISVANYHISKLGLINLKSVATAPVSFNTLSFGVRKEWPELVSILNKALNAIASEERLSLLEKWGGTGAAAHKTFLTAEESTWLKEHPVIRLGFDPNWAPVEYVDANGKIAGITSDNIRILSEKMDTHFEVVKDLSWSEVLQQARQGKIDIISAIVKSKERAEYLLFTQPYLKLPMVIVTRDDAPIIEGIQDLKGKNIAVMEDYITHSYLKRDYPNQPLLLFETLSKALQAVDSGEADALIENAAAVNLAKNELGLTRLTVAAITPYAYELSFGVRKDWPELIPILEKIMASITPREKQIIKEKWVNIRFQKETDWQPVFGVSLAIILIAGSIVTVIFNSNRRLVREVKQRSEAEEALTKARDAAEAANRAKSVFLANMSHELRTPLNAILGFSSMLGHDAAATPAQKEKLTVINRSGEHLLSMINDILDLSKIEAGRIDLEENSFDLAALLEEIGMMIQSRAGEKGLSFILETEALGFPYVNADSGKFRQILINLLGNAVKFTREGGITLRAATEPLPETHTRCQIVVEVEDTGPGIDPARQEKIFEPFEQEQGEWAPAGTGLGLSICKTFAELMDGSIEVVSETEKGALFRVRLPAGIVEAADVKTPETKPRVIGLAPGQQTRHILIADDHKENRLLLKALLEGAGFAILEAQNGKEAVDAFEKEAPDFIWMDMRMPVMDGYEATRQIRRRPGGEKLPIIAITASVFRSQRPDILAAGCDDMVFKPFREHEIFEVMARFLGVEYVYAKPDDAAPPLETTALTAAMLAELHPELINDLDQTTLVANREAILKVIERIEEHAPDTAALLRTLVHNFELERIRELLAELR